MNSVISKMAVPVNERPLVTLIPKKKFHRLVLILIVSITLFNIFAIILPVLKFGDFSSVWPVSDKRTGKKMVLFFMAWWWLFCLPACVPTFRQGIFCFYENRLEIKPFSGKKVRTIYYNEMSVTVHGKRRMTMNKIDTQSPMAIFQRFKNKYWDGAVIGLLPNGTENHEDVEKAVNILKDNAAVFNRKTFG